MFKHSFMLGCDPELFLQDAAEGFISSIGRIGGSKQFPRPLELGDGYAVQEDNVAIEFNIPAAEAKESFINNITKAREYLARMVAEQGLHFSKVSAVSFPITQLLDPQAMEFGCDPDFNAWANGRVNRKPKAADPTLRSAGGHVHVGYGFKSKQEVIAFTKYMDLFLGVPSTLMDNGDLRKQLYGKWGAFRYKPYGMEYRVLSNYWVFEEKLIGWVWDQVNVAMDAWQNNKDILNRELIHEAINNNNKDAARQLVEQHSITCYA